eukprot:gene17593-23164_t
MKQPCQSCSCFGNYQGCNLNVSYYGVIAGFLTDLYPYGSNSSIKNITITRVKGDTSDYQSLNPLNQLGVEYITGLRSPNNYLQNQFTITQDQIKTGISQWSTNVSDVYWTIPLQSTAARLAITSIPLYINIDKQLSEGPAYLSGVCSENMNIESDTDCNGQCFGPAVIAFNSVGALMCCLNGDVDCLDVCGGSAKRDACGTCQGTDFTAKGCQSLVAIETAWIDNNLYPNISLSTANYSETVYLNITNGNATAITISFSLTSKDNSNNGPDVYIPQGEYQLLVTGKQIDWEVKQIQVTYNFINNNDYIYESNSKLIIPDSLNRSDGRVLYANIIPNGYDSPDIDWDQVIAQQ